MKFFKSENGSRSIAIFGGLCVLAMPPFALAEQMICRGADPEKRGGYRITDWHDFASPDYLNGSQLQFKNMMRITFDRKTDGRVRRVGSGSNLKPGECGLLLRAMTANDPINLEIRDLPSTYKFSHPKSGNRLPWVRIQDSHLGALDAYSRTQPVPDRLKFIPLSSRVSARPGTLNDENTHFTFNVIKMKGVLPNSCRLDGSNCEKFDYYRLDGIRCSGICYTAADLQ